jgi:hypothetical protein
MENSSSLSSTSGRGEVYHIEIPRESKGARETLSDTPHSYFVEDYVDPFSGLDNKPTWSPCCQEAKIPEHFVSLDSFPKKRASPAHTSYENTEEGGLEVGIRKTTLNHSIVIKFEVEQSNGRGHVISKTK